MQFCLEDEIKSKQKKVQWKYLPDEICNYIFMNFCDFMHVPCTKETSLDI